MLEKTRKRIHEKIDKVDDFMSENIEVIGIGAIAGVSVLIIFGVSKGIKWAQDGKSDAVMYRLRDDKGFTKLMSGKEYVRFMIENGYTTTDNIHFTLVK